MSADYCSKILKQKHDKPFVLFAGLVRTHTLSTHHRNTLIASHWNPLNSLNALKDLSDTAPSIADKSRYGFQRYEFLMQEGNDELLKKVDSSLPRLCCFR